MKRYTEMFMKLRPGERRLVVIVGLVFFVVLNWIFIVPQFHGFARATARMDKAQKTLDMYRKEIAHEPELKKKIAALESAGSDVPAEEQAVNFERFYRARANENSVDVIQNSQIATHTNEFFLEAQMGISVNANETNLVNFLYALGSGSSTMRVRSMSLRPDPSRQKLNAGLTLVSSYQKKASPRATTPAAQPAKKTTGVPEPARKTAASSNKTATASASTKSPGVTNKLGRKL
jgi:hypothetical protein